MSLFARLALAAMLALVTADAGIAASFPPLVYKNGNVQQQHSGDTIQLQNVTGSTQCLQADASGNVTGIGSSCGTPGGLTLTIVDRTTTQSIPASTNALISWNTTAVRDDVGAFNGSNPTYVTVPSGYTHVRITLYMVWANNSTGQRQCNITQDALGTNFVAACTRAAQFQTPVTLVTGWLTVTSGEKLSAETYQDSGSSLNFGDDGSYGIKPYMQIEWAP